LTYRNSDDSLLAHTFHGTSNQVSNLLLTIGRDGAYLSHPQKASVIHAATFICEDAYASTIEQEWSGLHAAMCCYAYSQHPNGSSYCTVDKSMVGTLLCKLAVQRAGFDLLLGCLIVIFKIATWFDCWQHLRNLLSCADHLCTAFQVCQHVLYSKVDASPQVHRVHACCYRLASLWENGSGQHSCSGGTCTSTLIVSLMWQWSDMSTTGVLTGPYIICLRALTEAQELKRTISSNIICCWSNLFDKAGPNVLISVLKLNSLGYSDTIFGDLGAAISLLNNDIPALCRSKK